MKYVYFVILSLTCEESYPLLPAQRSFATKARGGKMEKPRMTVLKTSGGRDETLRITDAPHYDY